MHFHARLDYVERRDSRGPTGTNRALGRLRAFTRAGDFILCCVSNALPEGWDSDNTDVINLSTGGGRSPWKRLRSHWPDLDVEIDSVLTVYGVCNQKLVLRWLRYQYETAESVPGYRNLESWRTFFLNGSMAMGRVVGRPGLEPGTTG